MKKVLVIYYTQSGQLLDISKSVCKDLAQSQDIELSYYEIKLENNFPFPWNKKAFFNAFPESFLQIPTSLIDIDNPLLSEKYDLIIFAYQVWYLSPSIPANSFLKHPVAKRLLNDTPVITLIGARNMWIQAQEKVKRLLQEMNAKLVGNIALCDRHINHISVITIVHWMFTGDKNNRYLGVFPKPGVAQKDIDEAGRFGSVIVKHLQTSNFKNLQSELVQNKAVTIKSFLVLVDKRANVIFKKWANFIYTKGGKNSKRRQKYELFFSRYLVIAIWLIAPIVFLLFLLSYVPLFKKNKREKEYYSSVNLKK